MLTTMTGKEQKHEATANLMKQLCTFFSEFSARIALMPSPTIIHNKSDKPIFLIPISCAYGADPLTTGKIEDELVKIKKKDSESVDWSKYDRSRKTFSSEIRILFRAGSEKDDHKSFLKVMKASCREGIKLLKGEVLHVNNFLCLESHLHLKLEGGIVIVDKTGGQDGEKKKGEQAKQTPESSVTGTQERSTQDLIKQVEQLRNDVEALKNRMTALMDLFRSIASELSCPSSPNTPSSSKRF